MRSDGINTELERNTLVYVENGISNEMDTHQKHKNKNSLSPHKTSLRKLKMQSTEKISNITLYVN